jgi:3-oxoadipate enol-lactonase
MMHYEISGPESAPVLVLSNSLGTSMAMWNPQIKKLSTHLRVIRYDHRGHGESPLPSGPCGLDDLGRDVLEILDHLAIEHAAVCGVSLGGMVGMWLGIHAPERIGRLILCCTSAYLPPPEAWTGRAEAVRAAGSTAVVADAVLARWLTSRGREADPERLAQLRRMLLGTPAEGYAQCCGAIGNIDLRDELRAITAPTLVIAGGEDPATPESHLVAIANAIPEARLIVLDHAAHLANIERADAVTEFILSHCIEPICKPSVPVAATPSQEGWATVPTEVRNHYLALTNGCLRNDPRNEE